MSKVLKILAAHVAASMCPQDRATLETAMADEFAPAPTARVARSAISGQIVSPSEAKANPDTTVTQTVRKPRAKKRK